MGHTRQLQASCSQDDLFPSYLRPQLHPLHLLLVLVLPAAALVLVQLLLGVGLELAEGAGELVEVLQVLHQGGVV